MDALDTAILLFGSQRALARALGVSDQMLSNWKARGRVPVRHCSAIESVTGRRVSCHQLRPDIFPSYEAVS